MKTTCRQVVFVDPADLIGVAVAFTANAGWHVVPVPPPAAQEWWDDELDRDDETLTLNLVRPDSCLRADMSLTDHLQRLIHDIDTAQRRLCTARADRLGRFRRTSDAR